MTAIGSLGTALLLPAPPAAGLPPDGALNFADLSVTLAWALCGVLALSVGALFAQRDTHPRDGWVRKRLSAVCNDDLNPRVVIPLRSRAGGTNGRVPPRSAAGSPFVLRHVRRR